MKDELREKILNFNRVMASNKAKANDLMTILGALPPGQAKNLLKDETIGPILRKYGISGQ